MNKILHWISEHRITALLLAALVVGGGYYGYTKLTTATPSTQYVSATAEKGTLVTSVSGSGQVSVLNQIDIKPETSGRITSILVHNGQYVSEGQTIGRLDTTDAEKAVRDAQVNLDSSKLQLTILKESSANTDQLISDTYNEISNTFLDLPTIMTGLNDALHDKTIVSYLNLIDPQDRDAITPLVNSAESSYQAARSAYDTTFANYHTLNRTDPQDTIVSFANETADVATKTADAIKNTTNVLDYVNDYYTQRGRTIPAIYSTLIVKHKADLTTYTSEINPHIANLSSVLSSITNAPYNIASQELTIRQRENALADAQSALQYYTIRAPFSGVIATVSPEIGDTASPSSVFATLISSNFYAEIALNEVDVSKVKIGQKATLTFDAIDGLSLTGKVIEIDTIGTVSQGVVTYNVKIGFDGSSNGIKPGMSVTASIITDVKQDILLVPNAAVKTQGTDHYVEIVDATQNTSTTTAIPKRQTVVTGASNDTMTEIVSGLQEGDEVVIRSIAPTAKTTTQTQGSGLRIPGLGR